MSTFALPRFVVLNVPKAATNTYVCRKDNGLVIDGDDNMFSPLVKIEIEFATVDNKYIHLQFSCNNKYWQKNADDNSIVAISNKPEEDTIKSTCTLFESSLQSNELHLTHVKTGWRVMINNSTKAFYVDKNSVGVPLGFVDWDTLVKLPQHVAFKGYNEEYLKAYHHEDFNYLQFGSDDPINTLFSHKVSLMRDGHVRIKSYWGLFWRNGGNWIFTDSDDITANNKDTLFWPIKIDENTIALRSAKNNHFCKRLSTEGKISCLNAAESNLTRETRLEVQELVREREIYNVRYRMEDAKIFGETPFLAGKAKLTNDTEQDNMMNVSISYLDEKSYSFSRGFSLTVGVKTNIRAELPFIADGKVEVSSQVIGSLQWNKTTKTLTSVGVTDAVPVPARTVAIVEYVGTMGTCNILFSYTQKYQSSTDGEFAEIEQSDGIYEGISYYNFDFHVRSVKSG